MKRLLVVSILIILIALTPGEAFAQADSALQENTDNQNPADGDYFGLPLCLPNLPADGSCLLYGPAQVVHEMKAAGFNYPPRELPAATPPSELGRMPVTVARINTPEDQAAPIFATFEDAAEGANPSRWLDRGALRFVRYTNQRNDAAGRTFVQLTTGEWMRASPAAYTNFQGLEFFDNPRNNFGWIVDFSDIFVEPSFRAATTGEILPPYHLIQVYDMVEAEGYFWYKISPGEWVSSHKARVVTLRPTPPEGVTANRWIELDLFSQTIAIYEDGQLVFASLITSGRPPFYTRPGVFNIHNKVELAIMAGSFTVDRSDYYHLEAVPWQLYFDESIALHTAYWRTQFGYVGSHGCVNLSPGDAQWVYLWANEGDYVWVHDPSGLTPTDPSLFGPAGP